MTSSKDTRRSPDVASTVEHRMRALSHSSVNSYLECPNRFRLSRIHRLESGTWYATLAGTVIHDITEINDLNRDHDMGIEVPSFEEAFAALVKEAEGAGVDVKASGRKLKSVGITGGPNKKDFDWWLEYGPTFIENWEKWRDRNPFKTATLPDGTTGTETKLHARLGGFPTVAYVDRVMELPAGGYAIVDLKTGNTPTSFAQLELYCVMFEAQYGERPKLAGYWSAAKGDVGVWVDGEEGGTYLGTQFAQVGTALELGLFPPNTQSSYCGTCPVRDYCLAVGGKHAADYDQHDIVHVGPTDYKPSSGQEEEKP